MVSVGELKENKNDSEEAEGKRRVSGGVCVAMRILDLLSLRCSGGTATEGAHDLDLPRM